MIAIIYHHPMKTLAEFQAQQARELAIFKQELVVHDTLPVKPDMVTFSDGANAYYGNTPMTLVEARNIYDTMWESIVGEKHKASATVNCLTFRLYGALTYRSAELQFRIKINGYHVTIHIGVIPPKSWDPKPKFTQHRDGSSSLKSITPPALGQNAFQEFASPGGYQLYYYWCTVVRANAWIIAATRETS